VTQGNRNRRVRGIACARLTGDAVKFEPDKIDLLLLALASVLMLGVALLALIAFDVVGPF
jgi:hypothetical protein